MGYLIAGLCLISHTSLDKLGEMPVYELIEWQERFTEISKELRKKRDAIGKRK